MITSRDKLFDSYEEWTKCQRYIYKRDVKRYGWDWMHERSILGDEELMKNYLGKIMNEIDLMMLLKVNGKYIWEKEV